MRTIKGSPSLFGALPSRCCMWPKRVKRNVSLGAWKQPSNIVAQAGSSALPLGPWIVLREAHLKQLRDVKEPVTEDEFVALRTAVRGAALIHEGSNNAEISEGEGAQRPYLYKSKARTAPR